MANSQIREHFVSVSHVGRIRRVRDLAILFVHLLTTIAQLAGPGGARAVVTESMLVKHQLLILNRSRKRSPNLRSVDRVIAGMCACVIRPTRLSRSSVSSNRRPLCSAKTPSNANWGEFRRGCQ